MLGSKTKLVLLKQEGSPTSINVSRLFVFSITRSCTSAWDTLSTSGHNPCLFSSYSLCPLLLFCLFFFFFHFGVLCFLSLLLLLCPGGYSLPRTSWCFQVGDPIQTLCSDLKKHTNRKTTTILKKRLEPNSMCRNSLSLLVNAGHAIVYFLLVSVNTSHWEMLCHLSTVYHCTKKEEKKGGNPATTVCCYRGDVTAGVTVSGWDYLRNVSVTLTALQRYSACLCVLG